MGARWVVVKGGVSQMVCHQHVKPTRTLLRGHTHIPIYLYFSLFMIIYDYLCNVCVSLSITQPTGRDVEYAGSTERAAFPGQPGDGIWLWHC